jgi:hypothetical protein
MSYGCLLLSLGAFLFLLINPTTPLRLQLPRLVNRQVMKRMVRKVPLSDQTNVASGGERARLGNSGRGEGLDAMGGANEDNQNAMREAQVFNPQLLDLKWELQIKQKFLHRT